MFTLDAPSYSAFKLKPWQFSDLVISQVTTPVMLGRFMLSRQDSESVHERHCEEYFLMNRFKQVLPVTVPLLVVDTLESAAVGHGDGEGCWGRFRNILIPKDVRDQDIHTLTIIDPDSSLIRWAEISPADKDFYDYLSGLPKLRSV